jgi:hypothetical protein
MSQTSRGIFAAAAIMLTMGAVPLALGRDLSGGLQDRLNALKYSVDTPATEVNRTAKTDRAAAVARPELPTRTISLPVNGVSDTSVLVRIPLAQAARSGAAAPSWTRSGDGKRAVACEPVVSVLTDVAKRLEPGRCVT